MSRGAMCESLRELDLLDLFYSTKHKRVGNLKRFNRREKGYARRHLNEEERHEGDEHSCKLKLRKLLWVGSLRGFMYV